MLNEIDKIPVNGLVMMIKNEDGSFSPLALDEYKVMLLRASLQAVSDVGKPFARTKYRYVKEED